MQQCNDLGDQQHSHHHEELKSYKPKNQPPHITFGVTHPGTFVKEQGLPSAVCNYSDRQEIPYL
jgi:hypothetical protein